MLAFAQINQNKMKILIEKSFKSGNTFAAIKVKGQVLRMDYNLLAKFDQLNRRTKIGRSKQLYELAEIEKDKENRAKLKDAHRLHILNTQLFKGYVQDKTRYTESTKNVMCSEIETDTIYNICMLCLNFAGWTKGALFNRFSVEGKFTIFSGVKITIVNAFNRKVVKVNLPKIQIFNAFLQNTANITNIISNRKVEKTKITVSFSNDLDNIKNISQLFNPIIAKSTVKKTVEKVEYQTVKDYAVLFDKESLKRVQKLVLLYSGQVLPLT